MSQLQQTPKAQAKAQADRVIHLLQKEYPQAKIALHYGNSMQLLVAVMLSAQCTDKRVNIVTETLFKKYKTANDFANAHLATLEQEVRSTGFYRNKAKNIIGAATIIVKQFGGKVPNRMEDLLQLPGVARKTANIVLSNTYGINEGIAVDTHVKRLSFRLGLSKHINPEKIEKDLMQLMPTELWNVCTYLLIEHGRAVCKAPTPLCSSCILQTICPKKGVQRSR